MKAEYIVYVIERETRKRAILTIVDTIEEANAVRNLIMEQDTDNKLFTVVCICNSVIDEKLDEAEMVEKNDSSE